LLQAFIIWSCNLLFNITELMDFDLGETNACLLAFYNYYQKTIYDKNRLRITE